MVAPGVVDVVNMIGVELSEAVSEKYTGKVVVEIDFSQGTPRKIFSIDRRKKITVR